MLWFCLFVENPVYLHSLNGNSMREYLYEGPWTRRADGRRTRDQAPEGGQGLEPGETRRRHWHGGFGHQPDRDRGQESERGNALEDCWGPRRRGGRPLPKSPEPVALG